jgi:hypothetical protein
MGRRHHRIPQANASYEDWIAEDEIKLRWLMTRLQIINRTLDRIVPDTSHEALKETIDVMFEAVAQQKTTEATMLLEDALQANTSWLRGYLLLATIYQYTEQYTLAITTLGRGLNICANGLRLFSAPRWVAMVENLNGPRVHERLRRKAERFKRYEQTFRYRMAMLQIHTGRLDDAIEQWVALEGEHCV